jgi:hypothetical protein
MDDQTLQRLESKINKTGDCWLWTSATTIKGYGVIRIKQKIYYAHRVMYILYNGAIPDGLDVRHKCRNKCVNPEHLEIGTRSQNCQDMIRDGTDCHGERSPTAKLTAEQVLEIRRRFNESTIDLAKEFGVGRWTIREIITRRSWKHI